MNIQAEKLNIINKITSLNEESLINQLNDFLDTIINKNKKAVEPMDLETFYLKVEESEQAYLNKEIISHQDVKNEVKTWKKK